MESLKVSHYREVTRNKFQLESLQIDRVSTTQTLEKLTADESLYKSKLQFEKDGSKANPIQLIGLKSAESEDIGKHIIGLYKDWKPIVQGQHEERIGSLYGFNLYIRRQKEIYEKGLFEHRYSNSLYVQRGDDGIKYTYNNGLPNPDNPKLAARHFLNAIDRVESLKDKYGRTLIELNAEIPKLEQLTGKPFLQETELQSMKSELAGMERQIAIKIQENQLKHSQSEELVMGNENVTPVIQLIPEKGTIANGHTALKEVVSAGQSGLQKMRSRVRL